MTRLTRATLADHWPDVADALPGGGTGIVHLGLGAFHRAHQAVLTQRAMHAVPGDWAICGVAQRSTAVHEALRAQDCLFTVTERDAATERLEVVGSMREVLVAAHAPDRLTALLSTPDTQVVTITVTEAGYRHDPATGRLRADDPDVAMDLAGGPPRTVIGQLVRGLRARRALDAGLTVLSCDNLPDNGRLVAKLVHEFCAVRGEPALAEWIHRRVAFPSSVVDQIVPATTDADRRAAADRLGLTDLGAVVGEPSRQWVIEDRFAGPRPAWDRVGAQLVADIGPPQTAKLRLVNGTHSALAYLGLLAGCATTAEVTARPEFASYAERLLRTELGPSLDRPVGRREIETLLGRFANPRITHRLAQIAAGGVHKLPQRLLAPAAELLDVGREPRLICVALAGFLRYQEAESLTGALAVPEALRESAVFRDLMAEASARLATDGVCTMLRRL